MDYVGIINLIVVTVFFSTIIAPNLRKISDIKDEIISVDFPVIDGGEDTENTVAAKGIELNKKITRYQDEYNETKSFLRSFYFILGILAMIQFAILYVQGSIFSQRGLLLAGSLFIVYIVVRLVNKYMTDPSIVRSIQWLANKGISEAHTKRLFEPKLVLNGILSNIKADESKVTLLIRSNIDLNGYGYMLLVESDDCSKLYALNIGFIGNTHQKTVISSAKGESGSQISLFNFELNPGKYRARLLFLSQAYGGNYSPGETVMRFDVPKDGKIKPKQTPVDIDINENGYMFTVINKKGKQKLVHMESDQQFDGDGNLSFVLTSQKLLKYMSKGYRPIVLYSKNGDIDRYDLDKYLTYYRVWKRRIYKRFMNIKASRKVFIPTKGYLILLNRNPKSKPRSR